MKYQLKTRLTLWYLLLFAIIVGAWTLFAMGIVRSDLYAEMDRSLGQRASQIAAGLSSNGQKNFGELTDSTLVRVPRAEATAQLVAEDGHIIAHSGDAISRKPLLDHGLLNAATHSQTSATQVIRRGGETFRVLAVSLPHSQRFIVVGQSTETADATLRRLAFALLVTGPLALIAAALGGWILARRALRPVREMALTAGSIGIDRLGDRVEHPGGTDELSVLAETFNAMLGRLEVDVEEKRRFVNDASHALQTPLAVMRAELDVALSGPMPTSEAIEVLESVREETDRMTRTVRNLLALGRFDEGVIRLLKQPVDLHELASRAAFDLTALAQEHGVTVTVEGNPTVITADGEYLGLVVLNLLENAITYSGTGAHVTITTRTDGTSAILAVRDTGVGIPASAIPHLFDRFYRVEGSRAKNSGGSGLGLSIVRQIARAHGGDVMAQSASEDGTTFLVTLPVKSTEA